MEMSAAAGQTIAPFGMPKNGEAASQPVAKPENDEDAWYNKSSVPRGSDRKERGVIAKLLMLFVKLMPVAMVLYGGYYGYKQFFGEISAEEQAAYYRSPTAGAAGNAEAPTSRVGMMLQQAKDSIAAHDNNVHVANAIAENPGDLDGIQDSVDQMMARPVEAKAPPPQPKVTLAFEDAVGIAMAGVQTDAADDSDEKAAAPTNFSGPMSTASYGANDAGASAAPTSVTIVAKEISTAEPSVEFRTWVSRVSVSGVRGGEDVRAFVSGRLVRAGMTVDHRLGIVFSHIDPDNRLLMFRDKAGAMVGKRY